jgi:hypothetical protein
MRRSPSHVILRSAWVSLAVAVAALWLRSHHTADFLAYTSATGATADSGTRTTVAIASRNGVVTFTRSFATTRDSQPASGLRLWREPLDPRLGGAAASLELRDYAGFAWMHRPRAADAPVESQWTFAAAPWWAIATLLVWPWVVWRLFRPRASRGRTAALQPAVAPAHADEAPAPAAIPLAA